MSNQPYLLYLPRGSSKAKQVKASLTKISFAVFILSSTNLISTQVYAVEASVDSEIPTVTNNDKPEVTLKAVTITSKRLDSIRNAVSSSTGSASYRFNEKDIDKLPLGSDTPLNQVLLQAPGVVQDSYGQLHVRGDHANLQYRVNGVVIPESISGFGPAMDAHFASDITLLTGALPAQYGYRTAGIVEIKTKGFESDPGGEIGTVIGTQGNRSVNASINGSKGNLSYFLSGNYLENNLGIENPTSNANATHDHTQQNRGFAYLSYLLKDESRINLMLGTSNSRFQIPTRAGIEPTFTLANTAPIASQNLNANQHETNDFQVLSYQRAPSTDLNYQFSLFHRRSTVSYDPDPFGDLTYGGIAGSIRRNNDAYGSQFDSTYKLTPSHTLRAGLFYQRERYLSQNNAFVFPADSSGNQTSNTPFTIQDSSKLQGNYYGVYLQDEWKITQNLTLNYGARFDKVNTLSDEQQLSPRIGLVYDLSKRTRLHLGYARYFTPPPTEQINTTSIALFQNTTNALPSDANTTVKAERSNYFDLGISHLLTPQITLGLNVYYRQVAHLQDEGQFGNALIYSAFNYRQGVMRGIELSLNYKYKGFSAYANLSRAQALGKGIESGQFNFDQAELDYINNNWVHLDHDQMWTGSAGMAWTKNASTISGDLIFGSGMRNGFANTSHLPGYAQLNLAFAHKFDLPYLGKFNVRASVLNVLDRRYQLRDGTGIGVGAPQYGQSRTFYLSLSKPFGL